MPRATAKKVAKKAPKKRRTASKTRPARAPKSKPAKREPLVLVTEVRMGSRVLMQTTRSVPRETSTWRTWARGVKERALKAQDLVRLERELF